MPDGVQFSCGTKGIFVHPVVKLRSGRWVRSTGKRRRSILWVRVPTGERDRLILQADRLIRHVEAQQR